MFYMHVYYFDISRFGTVNGTTLDSLRTCVTLSQDLKRTGLSIFRRSASAREIRDPRKGVAKRRGCDDREVHIRRTNTNATTDLQIPAIARRRSSAQGGFFKRKTLSSNVQHTNATRRDDPDPECTSNRTSTVYALRLQPFRSLLSPPFLLSNHSPTPLFHFRRPVPFYSVLLRSKARHRILTFHYLTPLCALW